MERLEAVRDKRNTVPPMVTKATTSPTALPTQRKDLYKNMLLVREANKISQQLKKHTVSTCNRVELLNFPQIWPY